MNITLKKATKIDADEILKLMNEYYSYEGLEFNESESQKALLDLLSSDDYGLVDEILADERVIGYICVTFGYSLEYKGRDCVLDEIYIVSEYQRKGIGSRVLQLIEKQLYERGFKAVHSEVFERNEPALGFFLKNGFAAHKSSFMSKVL